MIVLESDGAFLASVDVLDFQNIIDNAPKDFDVIFLKDFRKCPGHFVKQFKSTAIGQNITHADGCATRQSEYDLYVQDE